MCAEWEEAAKRGGSSVIAEKTMSNSSSVMEEGISVPGEWVSTVLASAVVLVVVLVCCSCVESCAEAVVVDSCEASDCSQ